MPSLVTFDPCLSLILAPTQYHSAPDVGMSRLALKSLGDPFSYIHLQPDQQLLTPPSSPVPDPLSPFEQVPYEILDEIFGMVHADTSRDIYRVLRDLSACCLVSRKFHAVGINWLYRHVPVSDPYAFTKFLTQISKHPEKGMLVKTLDFSPFSVVSLGRSANDNKQIKLVCSDTLIECLALTPNLQEWLVSEALDPDLDFHVLSYMFNASSMPKLQTVDFCGCSRDTFVRGFVETLSSRVDHVTNSLNYLLPHIQRLSLHGCQTLPVSVYPTLLSHLPDLTHLDLSSTQLNSLGLLSISPRCRLRHLYLGNCGNLGGKAVLSFLLHHPASMYIESLNIRVNEESNHPIESQDVGLFLSALLAKGTVRSLDVCGMPVSDEHATEFPPTLVELGVYRTDLTPQGLLALLSNLPDLFYLGIEATPSGGRLRLGQYADVLRAVRLEHPHVRVVECSGAGIEGTDEIYDILLGWHWLHGRSRRGWLVSKEEYDELRKANTGTVKIGWKANKLNCGSTRRNLQVCMIWTWTLICWDYIGIMRMDVKHRRQISRPFIGSTDLLQCLPSALQRAFKIRRMESLD